MPEELAQVLGIVWNVAADESLEDQITPSLIAACDAAAPNTEDFRSTFTSAALNAANALAETLEFVVDRDSDHVVTVASLMRDTIDHSLQMSSATRTSESEIERHPLMLAEARRQKTALDALAAADCFDVNFIAAFRRGCRRVTGAI